MAKYELSDQEFAIVLAGLRFYAASVDASLGTRVQDIATDGGMYPAPSAYEISQLGDRLNAGRSPSQDSIETSIADLHKGQTALWNALEFTIGLMRLREGVK